MHLGERRAPARLNVLLDTHIYTNIIFTPVYEIYLADKWLIKKSKSHPLQVLI